MNTQFLTKKPKLYNGKKKVSSTEGVGIAGCSYVEECKQIYICIKLKSKWIKDLNMDLVTLNLIEEKMGGRFECMGTGDNFLNITPVAQTLRSTINK